MLVGIDVLTLEHTFIKLMFPVFPVHKGARVTNMAGRTRGNARENNTALDTHYWSSWSACQAQPFFQPGLLVAHSDRSLLFDNVLTNSTYAQPSPRLGSSRLSIFSTFPAWKWLEEPGKIAHKIFASCIAMPKTCGRPWEVERQILLSTLYCGRSQNASTGIQGALV